MSAFSKLFLEIYRDFITDGVPSSGANKPHKGDIRLWGATAERLLLHTPRIVTAAGAVTVDPSDTFIVIRKTVGAATSIVFPPSATFLGDELTIKDGKGDAGTNAITNTFDGVEACDGLSNVAISSNYGLAKFKPDPAGGWLLTQLSS